MAAGSRTRFALDLNSIMSFPDIDHMPVFPPKEGESWIQLLEITANISLFMRPVYGVKDKTGARLVVAMYTDDMNNDAKDFAVGRTLCIKNGMYHRFLDGQFGFRIEDASTVEVLPVSLKKLWALNAELRERSNSGKLAECNSCGGNSTLACTTCTSRYCSRECQKKDWRAHKAKCKALKALHGWNRTDFG